MTTRRRPGNPARRSVQVQASRPAPWRRSVVSAYQAADLAASRGAAKVLLDSNVWLHLSDGGVDADSLDRAVRDACGAVPVRLVASPSVVNEMLEDGDDERRNRRFRLLADPRWLRAIREVEVWVAEIVAAADSDLDRRHWLRRPPDIASIAPHIEQWRTGIWSDPDEVRLDITFRLHKPTKDAQHAAARHSTQFDRPSKVPDLSSLEVPANTQIASSDGNVLLVSGPIEQWRAFGWSYWRGDLGAPGRTGRVIADAYLDIGRMLTADASLFVRWWLEDLMPSKVPRTWLSWAAEEVQGHLRKPDRGDLVDRVHATSLVDCDLLLTCDKHFGRVLDELHRQAPFPTATPYTLRAAPFDTLHHRVADAIATHLAASRCSPVSARPGGSRVRSAHTLDSTSKYVQSDE